MKNTVFNLFNASVEKWQPIQGQATFALIQAEMLGLLEPIDQFESARLQSRIKIVRHSIDLWLLRADVYQLLAQIYGQEFADLQIRQLIPLFEQSLPPHMLVNI